MTKRSRSDPTSAPSLSPVAKRLQRLKGQTIQLAREPALNFFELAKLITDLHAADAGLLRDLPQQTGMSRRRLYYLLAVGQLIADQAITQIDAEAVGWTKLQIVARHLLASGESTPDHIGSLFRMARETRAHALAETLRGEFFKRTRAVMFHLDDDARSELNLALVAFGATKTHRGLTGKQSALIKMVCAATIQVA